MADPKAPEMPSDNDKFIRFVGCPRSPVPLAEIRDKLVRFYGLHIVTEADRKVLEFMAEVNPRRLAEMHDGISNLGAACDAELEARKTREK